MTATSNLSIETLEQNATASHTNFNKAMYGLDALSQMSVKSVSNTATTNANGDIYLVGTSGSSDFNGHSNKIAYYIVETSPDAIAEWRFITPKEGMQVYVQDKDWYLVYNGSSWVPLYEQSLNAHFLDPSVGMTSGDADDGWKEYTLDIATRKYTITEFHAQINLTGDYCGGGLGNIRGAKIELIVNGSTIATVTRAEASGSFGSCYPLRSVTGLSTVVSAGQIVKVKLSEMEAGTNEPPNNGVRICVHFQETN
jgi:hypothetical protein